MYVCLVSLIRFVEIERGKKNSRQNEEQLDLDHFQIHRNCAITAGIRCDELHGPHFVCVTAAFECENGHWQKTDRQNQALFLFNFCRAHFSFVDVKRKNIFAKLSREINKIIHDS